MKSLTALTLVLVLGIVVALGISCQESAPDQGSLLEASGDNSSGLTEQQVRDLIDQALAEKITQGDNNIQLVQGPAGPQGPKGDTGEQGAQGASRTFRGHRASKV